MSLLKKAALFSFLLSSVASAADVTILDFSVDGSGTARYEIAVSRQQSKFVLRTVSCGSKTLTAQEQLNTEIVLTGGDATEVAAIFANQAILAADQSVRSPFAPTGLWRTLNVNFQYRQPNGSPKEGKAWMRAPLVILKGKTSSILKRLETRALQASESICRD
jgi:hypothetical protein